MIIEMKPLPNDLLKHLTKALVERALQAELTHHLGHSKNQLVANTPATVIGANHHPVNLCT